MEIIQEEIKNLNTKKAGGPDGVQVFMLKNGGKEIAISLGLLFEAILSTGKSPKQWYETTVVPIPKRQGHILKAEDFRPISLISVVSKLFEKILCKKLSKESEEK